jgi:antitoxin (DNA-binding transcriptional repressor) of toxin-antitoxin stability system
VAHRAIHQRALRNHVGEVLRAPEAGVTLMITVRSRHMPRLARAAGQEADLL